MLHDVENMKPSQQLQPAHYSSKGCTTSFTKKVDFVNQKKGNVSEKTHSSTVAMPSSGNIKFLRYTIIE
ncbi:hypothetical protein KC19_VG301400 [Ceratodon purpureus]|uniref:Uncharacterized protein n=1 Tax=Ceratodon purpureus TaxID=3225 RepID=A0A8T0HW43_CERPU|nr:hypothetical protein KC19_VG301400 [Ceratodon purpureus]